MKNKKLLFLIAFSTLFGLYFRYCYDVKYTTDLFGFDNLKGFDMTRIYGFLAERFMSYWFQKNTKSITMPIIFYDIRNELN